MPNKVNTKSTVNNVDTVNTEQPKNDKKFIKYDDYEMIDDRTNDTWWMNHEPELYYTRFDPISEDTGEIYCITNLGNGKMYIGQSKSYRTDHGKIVPFGSQKRFKEHIYHASKYIEDSPKLNNAIREYGERAFYCNILAICPVWDLDEYETYFIKFYDTCKNGYNSVEKCVPNIYDNDVRIEKIQDTMFDVWRNDQDYIDKTTKANLEAIKKRVKTGETRTVHRGLPNNIYVNPRGGYIITIIRDGVNKNTTVQDKNKSDAELLELAIKKRDEIMNQMENGKVIDRVVKNADHNGNELPKCITAVKVGESNGYKVTFKRKYNGKTRSIERSFVDKKLTMDQKLQNAIDEFNKLDGHFEEEIEKIDAKIKQKKEGKKDHNNNPLPPGIRKKQQIGVNGDISEGYTATVTCSGSSHAKTSIDPSKSLDEKLEEVKKWLNDEGQKWLKKEKKKRDKIPRKERATNRTTCRLEPKRAETKQ